MQHMCQYMLDLSLTDILSVPFAPSHMAAASVCLARHLTLMHANDEEETEGGATGSEDTLENKAESQQEGNKDKEDAWSKTMHYYTTYGQTELTSAMIRLAKLLTRAEKAKWQVSNRPVRNYYWAGVGGHTDLVIRQSGEYQIQTILGGGKMAIK